MVRFIISFLESYVLIPTATAFAVLWAAVKFEDGAHMPESIVHPIICVILGVLLFVMLALIYQPIREWILQPRDSR